MSKYAITLNNFHLEVESLSDIFKFEDGNCRGLQREKYRDLLCDKFLQQFEKTVNIKWGRDVGKSITIELYCSSKVCKKKFKITQKKDLIKQNETVEMQVKSCVNICNHEDDKLIRQLRGITRKEVAEQVKATSVDIVRYEAMTHCDRQSLSKGNLQKIYTGPVLRQAASDLSAKNDLSKDPLYDLFLQSNKLKCVHSIEYKFERFNITLLSNDQIEILKGYIATCKRNSKVTRIHYDATGGILAKPNEDINNLFHHVLVIPSKYNENDDQGSFLNIGEMISSLHTSDQQEIFLKRFLQLASKQINSKGKIIDKESFIL